MSDKLEKCPMDGAVLHEIEDGEFGCQTCGRIWYQTGGGSWASKPRRVSLLKEPQEGDHIDEVVGDADLPKILREWLLSPPSEKDQVTIDRLGRMGFIVEKEAAVGLYIARSEKMKITVVGMIHELRDEIIKAMAALIMHNFKR